jgi:hypothetical protein
MPLRQWKEVQKMSRRCSLILGCLLLASALYADDQALWREFGLVKTSTARVGKLNVTTYQMKDLTGALAAWEWLRSSSSHPCDLSAFCTRNADGIVLWDDNYVVTIANGLPAKAAVDSIVAALPNKRDTALPAIFTFLPHQGLIPESARYVLGPDSLKAFAPELASTDPGFKEGAEAQVAEYSVPNDPTPLHLAIFYYPTPEMARLHSLAFKLAPNTHVKRSGVLVALVFGPATEAQADTLLSRIEYEAKVTWNDAPPPSPIKPLYQLLLNIMYLSILLAGICLLAGLIYAGMRLYRRRYGTLEQDEAMTTLGLTRD